MIHRRTAGLARPRLLELGLGLAALCALLLCGPAGARAEEEPADEGAAQRGRALFDQAAAWVRAGRPVQRTLRSVYADLQDVKITDGRNKHEGHMRVWLEPPTRLRWEVRGTQRATPSIKILDDNRMWIRAARSGARFERQHGTAEGAAAVAQLQKDRDRFVRLARLLTLSGMGGAGVRFQDQGVFERPASHHLAGRWLKVRRIPPQGRSMALLFASDLDAAGKRRATWPAGVLFPADAKAGHPAEHYVLKGWRKVAGRPLPAKVERWTLREDGTRFDRTLFAFVADLRIGEPLKQGLFGPGPRPARAAPAAGKPPAGTSGGASRRSATHR